MQRRSKVFWSVSGPIPFGVAIALVSRSCSRISLVLSTRTLFFFCAAAEVLQPSSCADIELCRAGTVGLSRETIRSLSIASCLVLLLSFLTDGSGRWSMWCVRVVLFDISSH